VPFLELHLHTKAGSADSAISTDQLGRRAAELGTHGLVVTEHFRVWTEWEREAFETRWDLRLYPAIEVTTNRGHVIVLGAKHAESLPGEVEALLPYARERGYVTIWAHPFRHYYDRIHTSQRPPFEPGLSPEQLAEDPTLQLVDAIEAVNGGCTEQENALAASVGLLLGKPLTTGSDAHDVHHIGMHRVQVPALPSDMRELGDLVLDLGDAATIAVPRNAR
jgi:predicted metal-dependent phosphoesterase TrpH